MSGDPRRVSRAYDFQKSVYLPASLADDAIEIENKDAGGSAGGEPPAETGEDFEWADADSYVESKDDVAMWVAQQPGPDGGDIEFLDIIFYAFPLMFLFIGLLLWVEITAVLWRRQRDQLLDSEEFGKAARGSPEDIDRRMMLARESHRMIFRPHGVWVASAGIFFTTASAIDVFGKCFWNWTCFFNIDCNLRIQTPAIADCAVDVVIPSAVLTLAIVSFIVALCWSCSRHYAAAALGIVVLTGIFAIATASLFACFLWLSAALAALYFYFDILPELPDRPVWCQDLGSLSVSSDPKTGEIKDGDFQQDWSEVVAGAPHPAPEALEVLTPMEKTSWFFADFVQRHLRGVRTLWNGWAMRGFVHLVAGNRVRVFGKENISHLGSADRVMLVANHRTLWDFWVITVLGLWRFSGAPVFSFYPVRSTYFYTTPWGLLLNWVFSLFAMVPPILNTPSDKASHESRHNAKFWNDYAVKRIVSELKMPGSLCGIFPEGTRNHSPDLHNILPCKPGVGRIALEVENVHVIPVFVHGIDISVWDLIKYNYTDAEAHPIDVVFGKHVDLTEFKKEVGSGVFTEQQEKDAATRITDELRALAKAHPTLVSGGEDYSRGYQESPL